MLKNYKYIFCLLLVGLLFFDFASYCLAQDNSQVPNNMDKAKNSAESILRGFPGVFQRVGNEAKGLYHEYVYSWLKFGINKTRYYLDKEVERRRPGAEQELKKELNEMKQDIPQASKSIWSTIKDFLY
jgi:hypothetical protein